MRGRVCVSVERQVCGGGVPVCNGARVAGEEKVWDERPQMRPQHYHPSKKLHDEDRSF